MTAERGRIFRRRVLAGIAVLWLVLVVFRLMRPAAEAAGTDWLTVAVVLLPLLIVYELWAMLSDWMRRRRLERDKGDA